MKKINYLDVLIESHPELSSVKTTVQQAAECLIDCYNQGGKLLVCGNGGSCSDSNHIVGELMKGFNLSRQIDNDLKEKLITIGGERGKNLSLKLQKGFPAISLTAHISLISALSNDTGQELVFAQQVAGYGKPGDVLLGISTSGNAENVLEAAITAKAMGIIVIGLTGESGGALKNFCDILINVPGSKTYLVQELHLPVYHTICLIVEDKLFGK